MKNQDLKTLAAQTQALYTKHGKQFDLERTKVLFEKVWLDRFLELLPPEGTILDVGCGSGEPIAKYLIEQDFKVTGIDFSQTMIDIVQKRFPDHHWIVADMRQFDLQNQFDGLIGWHSFFHLTPDEQRAALACFEKHLKSGGIMMLTVGPHEGEVVGQVCGDPVYHSSLSFDNYEQALKNLRMKVVKFVPEDPECDFTSVLLAKKN